MRASALLALGLLCAASSAARSQNQSRDTLRVDGLRQPVEIVRDHWGMNHIYARNEHDLFFAQGYAAARDRLFQLELWRRQATGTVAELLGPREIARDIGARLFRYRGDMARELASYHPRGAAIVQAFVDGINAYVAATERDTTLLPIEFRLLATKPGRWTPEVVISRHQGLLGNAEEELTIGRAVAAVGPDVVKSLMVFEPGDPDLRLDPSIDAKLLQAPILALYEAWHSSVRFQPSDLAAPYRGDDAMYRRVSLAADSAAAELRWNQRRDIGSNNWVVSGRLTQSGHAMMANDPHRAQSAPSLRYWAHLVAPGWNVIGGGEPVLPGLSIGHNERGAWGLTIFETDGEDLYMYRTDPANPRRYRYRGAWEAMRVVHDSIRVKGQPPVPVELRFTRHGPVVYEDTAAHVAWALRAAWLEPGSAPYMASLRMDQARTWEEFRAACAYGNIPGENMVWADRAGNIGWQAVGIAPIRRAHSGLVPVPGDGRFEWSGFLPILEKPHAANPASGFIATANNDLVPPGYPHMDAVGFTWADPYRWARISEVLGSGRKLSMMDMMRLQTDYTSLPARQLVPLLADVPAPTPEAERARWTLLEWDGVLEKSSIGAGIYEAWYRRLADHVRTIMVPAAARPHVRSVETARLVQWLTSPTNAFGANPTAARDSLLVRSLVEATAELTQRFGEDQSRWSWGQDRYHHVLLSHPLGAAVSDSIRRRLNVGPLPRGGDGNTPGATGGGDNQTSGASFRIVADVGDWETAMGTNTPGQSGNPDDPHYRDLFAMWANDRYFPVAYDRRHVDAVAERMLILTPGTRTAAGSGDPSHARPAPDRR